tara:strand:+ start:11323 stop:12087 length:765 start_codon:yes stop_codon:yes gene_type:complete
MIDKLLQEFVTKSILLESEEDIFKHNLNIIKQRIHGSFGWGRSLYDALDTREVKQGMDSKKVILHILRKIPPLKNLKLIRPLGVGRSKFVYLLQNDHVFIIMYDISGEFARYRKFHDQQFSGVSTKNQPAIYDYGMVKGHPNLMYVEMSRVIPLNAWIDLTQRNDAIVNNQLSGISLVAQRSIRLDDKDNIKKLNNIDNASNPTGLTQKEVYNIYKEFVRILKTHGKDVLWDMHTGNLGIMPQYNDAIVVYDFD